MNKIRLTLLALIIVLPSVSFSAIKLTPKEIMEKNEDARKVMEFQATSKLTTGPADGNKNTETKIKEFTLWRKIQSDGIHNSTFTRFHAPAEVRNEGILIVENASGKNDVLLYLPAYKKIRRVESQQQSGSFMGSAFSYSDVASPHIDDYTYKMIKEEKCPTAEAAAQTCAVIESTPANDDVKERTSYSKMLVWVREDNFMTVQTEDYGLDGALFKKIQLNQIKMVDPKAKKWLSLDVIVTNFKTNEYTRLEYSNVKVNTGIPDSVFTQQNLQKVN